MACDRLVVRGVGVASSCLDRPEKVVHRATLVIQCGDGMHLQRFWSTSSGVLRCSQHAWRVFLWVCSPEARRTPQHS